MPTPTKAALTEDAVTVQTDATRLRKAGLIDESVYDLLWAAGGALLAAANRAGVPQNSTEHGDL